MMTWYTDESKTNMGKIDVLRVVWIVDNIFKIRDIANKGPSHQGYGFSSSHVWMWELDDKESWAVENDAFELWY